MKKFSFENIDLIIKRNTKFSFLRKSETKYLDFDRKSNREEFKNLKFELAIQKKISWLWFEFIFNLKPKKRMLVEDFPPTDMAFSILPPYIVILDKKYFLKIEKMEKVKVWYEEQNDKSKLSDILIETPHLRFSLISMLMALKDTDNIKFVKNDYKKKLEEFHNIEIPYEKKFDTYYQ